MQHGKKSTSQASHQAQSPFANVSEKLREIGALSVDSYLYSITPAPADKPIIYETSSFTPSLKYQNKLAGGNTLDDKALTRRPLNALETLNRACQRAFHDTSAIKYNFERENEKSNWQCTLVITRTDGTFMTYDSEKLFHRKVDAKLHVAELAIKLGALDFITPSNVDNQKTVESAFSGLAPVHEDVTSPVVNQIEACCAERSSVVKSLWVSYDDRKGGDKFGVALRISHLANEVQVYSTDAIYNTPQEAKIACAQIALQEGVLEFVRKENLKEEPGLSKGILKSPSESLPVPITLQEFYESLPKPFPEVPGKQSATEVNAISWINNAIQSAKGLNLKSRYYSLSKTGLFGCLYRLSGPHETKSYMVDALFSKRGDAKTAVGLLAISQGVGSYVRDLRSTMDNKIPSEKRALVEEILTTLFAECKKLRSGNRPEFSFTTENDVFGCILNVDISTSNIPDKRCFTVPPGYPYASDAKAAVALLAAESGIIDLLRRGRAGDPDYVPFWDYIINKDNATQLKRKDARPDIDNRAKKRWKGNRNEHLDFPSHISMPTVSVGRLTPEFSLESRQFSEKNPSAGFWTRPHTSEIGNFTPVDGARGANRHSDFKQPVDRGVDHPNGLYDGPRAHRTAEFLHYDRSGPVDFRNPLHSYPPRSPMGHHHGYHASYDRRASYEPASVNHYPSNQYLYDEDYSRATDEQFYPENLHHPSTARSRPYSPSYRYYYENLSNFPMYEDHERRVSTYDSYSHHNASRYPPIDDENDYPPSSRMYDFPSTRKLAVDSEPWGAASHSSYQDARKMPIPFPGDSDGHDYDHAWDGHREAYHGTRPHYPDYAYRVDSNELYDRDHRAYYDADLERNYDSPWPR